MFFYIVLTPISTTFGLWSTDITRKYHQIDVYIYQCGFYCCSFIVVVPIVWWFCVDSLFWGVDVDVFSSFAIILLGKRDCCIVFLLSCGCFCSVVLLKVFWVVSDCGISCLFSLFLFFFLCNSTVCLVWMQKRYEIDRPRPVLCGLQSWLNPQLPMYKLLL